MSSRIKSRAAAALATVVLAAGCQSGPDVVPQNPETILFGFDTQPFDASGIETAASLARRQALSGAGSVEVAGHADTAGDARYNRWLADRRASFTRRELIARGVPVAALSTRGLGETAPVVATGDGVRERENRRVEVTLAGEGALPAPDEDRPVRFPLPSAPAAD
jgi:outer membrane protein OmpA-like peptidoglycan-associated protein